MYIRVPDCENGQFLCDITRCIPQNEVCDGLPQCRDGSDEENCPERGESHLLARWENSSLLYGRYMFLGVNGDSCGK